MGNRFSIKKSPSKQKLKPPRNSYKKLPTNDPVEEKKESDNFQFILSSNGNAKTQIQLLPITPTNSNNPNNQIIGEPPEEKKFLGEVTHLEEKHLEEKHNHKLPPELKTYKENYIIIIQNFQKINPLMDARLNPFPDILGFKMVNFQCNFNKRSFICKAVLWLQIPLKNNVFYMDGDEKIINMSSITPKKDHKYSCRRVQVIGVQFIGRQDNIKFACLAYQQNLGMLVSIHDANFRYEINQEIVNNRIGNPGFGCKEGIYFWYSFQTACGYSHNAYPLITGKYSEERKRVKEFKDKTNMYRIFHNKNRISYNSKPSQLRTSMKVLCEYRTKFQRLLHLKSPYNINQLAQHYKLNKLKFN